MSRESRADLSTLEKQIEKTGFVIETPMARQLKEAGWTVNSNRYYVDDAEENVREIDLVAYLLRSAVGIRAILGTELTSLAIKALLVHAAEAVEHDKLEVGGGKMPEDLMSIITCPEGVARAVYQGELKPSKYLRASLPLPTGGLTATSRRRPSAATRRPIRRMQPLIPAPGWRRYSVPTTRRSRTARPTLTRRAAST